MAQIEAQINAIEVEYEVIDETREEACLSIDPEPLPGEPIEVGEEQIDDLW